MRKDFRTKKTSTPKNPPGKYCLPAWRRNTPSDGEGPDSIERVEMPGLPAQARPPHGFPARAFVRQGAYPSVPYQSDSTTNR